MYVFPAPAGINRGSISSGFADTRVPRASGDKPVFAALTLTSISCSPRQRG
ncbi:hypothetical protein AC83_3228 [Escherichia coli 1-250-04_S4_C1]|nr:hypothetical protein AC83_3228 [Escherichia coli 1-250-04_S4_C1]